VRIEGVNLGLFVSSLLVSSFTPTAELLSWLAQLPDLEQRYERVREAMALLESRLCKVESLHGPYHRPGTKKRLILRIKRKLEVWSSISAKMAVALCWAEAGNG
jgi:hypothetical protein